MLVAVAIVSLAALLWFSWRLYKDWPTSPARGWLLVPVAAAGIALFASAWLVVQHESLERELTATLQEVMSRDDVSVQCPPPDEVFLLQGIDGGWAIVGGDVANLMGSTCDRLAEYAQDPGVRSEPSSDHLYALAAVEHEVAHLEGIENGRTGSCQAVNEMHRVALALGATEAQAREHQLRYFEEVFPSLLFEYYSETCELIQPPAGE